MSSETDNFPHAVVSFGCDSRNIFIKNSYTDIPRITIPTDRPSYTAFLQDPTKFRSNHSTLTDNDYIVGAVGYVLEFKCK